MILILKMYSKEKNKEFNSYWYHIIFFIYLEKIDPCFSF